MSNYSLMYRLGFTPWERYGRLSDASIAAQLDRVSHAESRGRALDLGCGRGMFTPQLARRGWDATGIDIVPKAIKHARRRNAPGIRYLVGDVTRLREQELGTFDLFLDIGCFQGLDPQQRTDMSDGVTHLANPGATLLMLAFGPSRYKAFVEGVSRADIDQAFRQWQIVRAEAASTRGLGWPMNRTNPRWYELRLASAA